MKGHINTQQHNGITWTDVRNPTRDEVDKVVEGLGLHPLHLDTSLLTGHLTHIEKEPGYLFLLLQLPGYHQADDKVVSQQLAIFLGKNYLITIHYGVPYVQNIFNVCLQDERLHDQYFKKSPGYLLYRVLDALLNDAASLVQGILAELDVIEDVVFDSRSSAPYKIGKLRQRIIKLKQHMDLLKETLDDLAESITHYSGENLSRQYRGIARQVQKLSITLSEARETIEIFKDTEFTVNTEQTNKILAILTIIFTYSIPATVVGTFYGMNIPIPGNIISGAWTFWGPYTSLIFAIIVSILPVLGMVWYFKKKKWL